MCQFPALALVREMRRVCALADLADDPKRIQDAAEYVRLTNMLRLHHEDLTDCHCWFHAVQQANAEAA